MSRIAIRYPTRRAALARLTPAMAMLAVRLAAAPSEVPGNAAGAPATNAPPPALALTLDQAVSRGLAANRDLAALALQAGARDADRIAAESDFRFTLVPDAAVRTDGDVSRATVGLSASRMTEWGTALAAGANLSRADGADADAFRHRGTVTLEARQPLLRRFGPLVTREAADLAASRVTAARREWEMRRNDLALQIARLHEDLLRLERQAQRDAAGIERLRRLARLTAARERQGRATRLDTLRIEMRLAEAELNLTAARERRESQAAEFAEWLGLPPDTRFALHPAPRIELPFADVAEATDAALRNRLDYAQILDDRRDARRGALAAERRLLPDLEAVARYERIGQGATPGDAARMDTDLWLIGLSGSADLPAYRARADRDRAAIAADTADIRVEAVEAAIRRQVRQEWLAHERAHADLPAARRNLEAALKRETLARRLHESGAADSLAVTDAEDELRTAHMRLLDAEAEAVVVAWRLLRASGALLECPADLRPRGGER